MEIIYTESAEKEIQSFLNSQKKLIEEIIKRNKYIFGDKIIEITASDIKEAQRYIKVIDYKATQRASIRKFMLGIYLFIGIWALLFGIFYNSIMNIINNNPTQFIIITIGITMTSASFFLYLLTNFRTVKKNEMFKKIENLNNKIQDIDE